MSWASTGNVLFAFIFLLVNAIFTEGVVYAMAVLRPLHKRERVVKYLFLLIQYKSTFVSFHSFFLGCNHFILLLGQLHRPFSEMDPKYYSSSTVHKISNLNGASDEHSAVQHETRSPLIKEFEALLREHGWCAFDFRRLTPNYSYDTNCLSTGLLPTLVRSKWWLGLFSYFPRVSRLTWMFPQLTTDSERSTVPATPAEFYSVLYCLNSFLSEVIVSDDTALKHFVSYLYL